MRQQNSGSWYLQANVDITKGIRWVDDEVYTMWNAATDVGSETAYATTATSTTPKRIITYQSNSGNSSDVSVVGVGGSGTGFKTAVVANRRVYAGNVKYTDSTGNTVIRGDAVIKSPVNMFDIFPSDNVIEGPRVGVTGLKEPVLNEPDILDFSPYCSHIQFLIL